MQISLFVYNCFLSFYSLGARLLSLYNKKAAAWVTGRRGLHDKVAQWRMEIGNAEVIWMHCASLGEFEQGRPVLERLRGEYPSHKFLLTFFSPSGYEIRKNYAGADAVFYLPMDGAVRSAAFIDKVNPVLVLWVKYEFWYYYLTGLKKRNIPVVLVSGIFRRSQDFFKFYGGFRRQMLRCFRVLFVQHGDSINLLSVIKDVPEVISAGDTRFDRVIVVAGEATAAKRIRDYCSGKKVIVAGSTWEEDEELLAHYAKVHPGIIFIIAPHEIDEERLRDAEKLFAQTQRWSAFNVSGPHVLLIDNIGLLASLYQIGDLCYIGGGFNASGIHNILEAAVYGKPILFGPNYQKFREADELVSAAAAFPVNTALEFETIADELFANDEKRILAETVSKNFVARNAGATEVITDYIQRNLLRTN